MQLKVNMDLERKKSWLTVLIAFYKVSKLRHAELEEWVKVGSPELGAGTTAVRNSSGVPVRDHLASTGQCFLMTTKLIKTVNTREDCRKLQKDLDKVHE